LIEAGLIWINRTPRWSVAIHPWPKATSSGIIPDRGVDDDCGSLEVWFADGRKSWGPGRELQRPDDVRADWDDAGAEPREAGPELVPRRNLPDREMKSAASKARAL
jgi:hypothetical protein